MITLALSWLTSGWASIVLPALRKIPWQLWAVLLVVLGVFYYGHVRYAAGYAACNAKYELALKEEQARQRKVFEDALAAAKLREADARQRLSQTEEDLNAAKEMASKLKDAKRVCVPSNITARFTKPRGLRKH